MWRVNFIIFSYTMKSIGLKQYTLYEQDLWFVIVNLKAYHYILEPESVLLIHTFAQFRSFLTLYFLLYFGH
jgi:hypothetical protein